MLLCLLVVPAMLIAQLFPPIQYPTGYFRNPLGIPLQLSANFGELRPNHYHMGFDIRTNQVENLPVYASAEGYISRVSIERYGFGRAIYITHPNGYTTVYAHLNDFYRPLNSYVKDKQYAEEKWEQDITFESNQFPVVKGQFIGYSGNTGGSAGPHLHFEIRDTKTGNNLNPWLFNFGLADAIPPYLFRLYYYDRRYSTYQVAPLPIPIIKTSGGYATRDSIVSIPTPTFSFGFTAEDKSNTSAFLFGIYQAELYLDDTARFAFRLNDFSYTESRLINAAIDYRTKYNGGPYIQHLSRLPGNHSSIFSDSTADGVIIVADTLVHTAAIHLKDAAGNTTITTIRFRYDPFKQQDLMFAQNFLSFLPNQQNQLDFPGINASFPASSFYHIVPFVYAASWGMKAASATHQLFNAAIPVQDSFTVRLQLNDSISPLLKDKVVMQLNTGKKKVVTKGEWQDNWMSAKFWDLGAVRLIADTIKPTITPVGWKNGSTLKARKSFAFVVRDDVGEISSFRAELDGKWLLFCRKDHLFIHDFDERTTQGKHSLRVQVQDEAGNITDKMYTFIK